MYSSIFNIYIISLLGAFVIFIISFFLWIKDKNMDLKKIMLIFLTIFFILLLIGVSFIGYILYGVIKSN